jgi:hypothetical protein
MPNGNTHRPQSGFGYVRTLSQPEELPLLRDHLLILDREFCGSSGTDNRRQIRTEA